MTQRFLETMRRATDATRSGDLTDATRMIREALSGSSSASEDGFDGVTIDGTAERAEGPSSASPMLSRTYRGAAGQRAYRLFVPQAPDGVRGLILMLHGCTQNPEDFALGTAMNRIAAREGLVVAYPAQTKAYNPNACWNWFEPQHQRRGAGEAAILAGLAGEVAREYGVPEGRVFAAGLSAGGAMAAVLGATYPDVFSAIGVHSGLAAGSAHDVATAFAAMKGKGTGGRLARDPSAPAPRLMVVHGHRDRTVVPANGMTLLREMEAAYPQAALRREPTAERGLTLLRLVLPDGTAVAEHWEVAGLGHAWSGGDRAGSFTSPRKPNASEGFVRFFLDPKG